MSDTTSSEALAARGTTGQIHTLNAVILSISALSALGSAWMILNFIVIIFQDPTMADTNTSQLFKQARLFRHKLIL
jgi:hypothetical protein